MSDDVTTKYARKPFFIDAVRVTEENLFKVMKWCGGEMCFTEKVKDSAHIYIKVRVPNARTPRMTMAFVGDWVVKIGPGYKVYEDGAFSATFSETDATNDTKKYDTIYELVRDAMVKLKRGNAAGVRPYAEATTRKILGLI